MGRWSDEIDTGHVHACSCEPFGDHFGAEAESAMSVLGLEERECVWREVDDEDAAARCHESRRFTDRARRVVEEVQHLVQDDQVERRWFERRRVGITLAEFDIANIGSIEVGAGNGKHGVTAVEPDRSIDVLSEELQHATRAGADIEQRPKRHIIGSRRHSSFDGGVGGVQRPNPVPVGGDIGKVLLRRVRSAAAHRREPIEICCQRHVELVDRSQHVIDERSQRTVRNEREVHPSALAVAIDDSSLDQEFQVPRDARLRLTTDVGEVGDGELTVAQQGDQPQSGRFTHGAQRVEG